MRDLKLITNDKDYSAALKRVAVYFEEEPMPGSNQADHFESLINLIESYEAIRYSIS